MSRNIGGDDPRTRRDAEHDAETLEKDRLRAAKVQEMRRHVPGLNEAVEICTRMEDHFDMPSNMAWRILMRGPDSTSPLAVKLRESREAGPWMQAYCTFLCAGREIPPGLLAPVPESVTVGSSTDEGQAQFLEEPE